MRLIFLGAPGVGKGVQSRVVSEYFGLPIISSGDLLRAFAKRQAEDSDLNGEMNGGALISDEFVMKLVLEAVSRPECANGYILDGVPRTVNQANALEHGNIKIDTVVYITAPDEVVKSRILNRVGCEKCNMIYKGNEKEVCDKCGGKLTRRKDDNEHTVQKRLDVYHSKTEALVEYYREKQLLKTVDGDMPIEEVSVQLIKILKGSQE